MIVITEIPALLGRSTDILTGDLSSNLEILQQALYPLPEIPGLLTLVNSAGAPQLQKNSFLLNYSGQVANGAAVVTQLATLGKGLWKLSSRTVYWSNYGAIGYAVGFGLSLNPLSGTFSYLVNISPNFGPVTLMQEDVLTQPVDGWSLISTLGLNTVGQAHQVDLTIHAEKYL